LDWSLVMQVRRQHCRNLYNTQRDKTALFWIHRLTCSTARVLGSQFLAAGWPSSSLGAWLLIDARRKDAVVAMTDLDRELRSPRWPPKKRVRALPLRLQRIWVTRRDRRSQSRGRDPSRCMTYYSLCNRQWHCRTRVCYSKVVKSVISWNH